MLAIDSEMASNNGFGATDSPSPGTLPSPQTFSFNNRAGNLLILFAGIGVTSANTATFGTVSYGGVTMTSRLEATTSGGSTGGRIGLFYLLNPPTGSNTVSIGFTTANVIEVWGGCTSYTGADPSDPFAQTPVASQGNSTTASGSLSNVAGGNLVIAGAGAGSSMTTQTQTLTWAANVDGGSSLGNGRASVSSTLGSVTHQFTISATDSWATVIAEIKSAAGNIFSPHRMPLGV